MTLMDVLPLARSLTPAERRALADELLRSVADDDADSWAGGPLFDDDILLAENVDESLAQGFGRS